MIDKPENGHNPEIRDMEADPARDAHTATTVAEPDAHISQPGEMQSEQTSVSSPEMSSETVTTMTEPAPTAEAAGDESTASAELPAATEPVSESEAPGKESTASTELPATTEPVSESEFSSELTKFRLRFEEIQAEFIGAPSAAVEKAETLIDGLMSALHDQLHRIHSNVESETDTEQLRLAMLGYRELFDSLGGHRAA